MIVLNHGQGDRITENQMENMGALVDLVRALSEKCSQLETYKNRAEMYQRWYERELEKKDALQAELNKLS
jgi:hypothetical protein